MNNGPFFIVIIYIVGFLGIAMGLLAFIKPKQFWGWKKWELEFEGIKGGKPTSEFYTLVYLRGLFSLFVGAVCIALASNLTGILANNEQRQNFRSALYDNTDVIKSELGDKYYIKNLSDKDIEIEYSGCTYKYIGYGFKSQSYIYNIKSRETIEVNDYYPKSVAPDISPSSYPRPSYLKDEVCTNAKIKVGEEVFETKDIELIFN